MLHAAAMAAAVGGWDLVAHCEKAAILKVYCRSSWVGVVVITSRGASTTMTATLAKPVSLRTLFIARHNGDEPLPVWIFRLIRAQFRPMQTVSIPRQRLRWLVPEKELLDIPVQLACVALGVRILNTRRMSSGVWRFVTMPPWSTVVLRLSRWTLTISVSHSTATTNHGGIFDETVDPPWHASPDVLKITEWIFTCSREFQEAHLPRFPSPSVYLPGAQRGSR